MATVTDNLADAETRHTVYLLRWSAGTYSRHSRLIDELATDLAAKLAARAPADGSFTAARLSYMLENVETMNNDLFKALDKAIDGDFRDLAAYEARFHVQAIQSAYPIEMAIATVTPAQIHAAAMSRPFQGRVLRDWWAHQNYTTREAFKSALRLGYTQGETISQMVTRMRGVTDMTRREIEAIIRTATAHMGQVARNKVNEANTDIFAGETYIATLDGRTTATCRGYDGQEFAFGKGPIPPVHFNCRSVRVARTKTWKELGFDGLDENDPLSTRPFVADKRRVKDIPQSQRDTLVGTTTKRTYNDWLKTQPRGFVEEVLGKDKAALYLDGKLPLDRFIDRQGRELTLAQLEAREASDIQQAWKKAFG